MEEKNAVLDVIIEFTKAIKTKDQAIEVNSNGKLYKIWHCKYLLNQILRQWEVPEKDRWFISKKAKDLWEQLTDEPIEKFHYNDIVICKNDVPIKVKIYKGNEREGKIVVLNKGNVFKFNSIFHEEHVVPISMIIDELLKLEDLNYKNVGLLLDKLVMCRILKEEDKELNKTHSKLNRSLNAHEVFAKNYKKALIDIVEKR